MTGRRVAVLGHTAVTSGAELALLRWAPLVDHDRYVPVVVLFADGPLVELLRKAGVETYVVPLAAKAATANRHSLHSLGQAATTAAFARRLAWRLKTLEVDLVHTNSLKADVISALAAPFLRRPLVWQLHDRISDDYLPRVVARGFRSLVRRVPRHVVVNSMATLATVQPLRRGWTLAYPGLSPEQFATGERQHGAPHIGMIGRISPTKGQREFLYAAAQVHQTHPQARFTIVGSAMFSEQDYEADIRKLTKDLGLADCVDFAGYVSDPASLVGSWSAVVHASPVPEPFGQVIAEAMALRVPVIATEAGGAIEIMRDGSQVLGQLVAPGDIAALATAMRRVIDDPATAAATADRAYDSVRRRFTIEQTVTAVMDAWDRVLG